MTRSNEAVSESESPPIQLVQYVRVWSLMRGIIDPSEPLDERNNLLVNLSQACQQFTEHEQAIRKAVEKLTQ